MSSNDNFEESALLFLSEVGKLKETPRRGWELKGIIPAECVAGHMYRMAISAIFSLRNVHEFDMNKVIKLCLVHDIAEGIVGDIIPPDGIAEDEKHRRERDTVQYLAKFLPTESQQQLISLYEEYEKKETKEARLTKDLDIFDMVLQAFEYEKKALQKGGKLPDLTVFFNHEKVIQKVENEEVKAMVAEILQQRKKLLMQCSDGNKCNQLV